MTITDEEACREPLEQDHPLYNSEVPLAVVLDDRLEVGRRMTKSFDVSILVASHIVAGSRTAPAIHRWLLKQMMQQPSLGALQVWDKRAQAQVLQVAPFLPRRPRSVAASAQQMAAEMERVQVLAVTQCLTCFWHVQHLLLPEHSAAARCQHPKGTMQQGVVGFAAGGTAGPARAAVLGLQRGADAGRAEAVRSMRQARRLAARARHAAAHHAPHLGPAQGARPLCSLAAVAGRFAMHLRNICVEQGHAIVSQCIKSTCAWPKLL